MLNEVSFFQELANSVISLECLKHSDKRIYWGIQQYTDSYSMLTSALYSINKHNTGGLKWLCVKISDNHYIV